MQQQVGNKSLNVSYRFYGPFVKEAALANTAKLAIYLPITQAILIRMSGPHIMDIIFLPPKRKMRLVDALSCIIYFFSGLVTAFSHFKYSIFR